MVASLIDRDFLCRQIGPSEASFGEFPSDELIVRLARALDADTDELLILAEKIPDAIRKRVLQRRDPPAVLPG